MIRTDRLTVLQGATWETRWPILDTDGQPYDLTGWTVQSQVRASATDVTVLFDFAATGNATTLDNNVVLTIPADVSSAWTWTEGVFDIELHNADAVVRITQGTIEVNPEVTRG
jgi:hypothetical protein